MSEIMLRFYSYKFSMISHKCICLSAKFHVNLVRFKSHYNTLGLESNATQKDIKSAYYEMSLKHHPDKNEGSQESIAKFREISEAYETLSDPEKKSEYDLQNIYDPSFQKQKYRQYYGSRVKTGYSKKSNVYDYDEHYRQHYGYSREAENEYFRRRWEADFYRRYPTAEHFYRRNKVKEEQEEIEEFLKSNRRRRSSLFYLAIPWIFIFCFLSVFNFQNPENSRKRVYYNVKESKGK